MGRGNLGRGSSIWGPRSHRNASADPISATTRWGLSDAGDAQVTAVMATSITATVHRHVISTT
ncbi:hypothetical protein CH281_23975 [Rhodococcus sp. 06-221-2]|nr:hypothetical protein CH281_23975 [Rhodococcus sp. 06-221-2]